MRVAGLRGDRYFTRFEVFIVMKLAACSWKRHKAARKMIICVNILSLIVYFHINSCESKEKNATSGCELRVLHSQ